MTQAQYRAVMGTNPSYFKSDDLSVEQVSWNDAVAFCRKLSQASGIVYRLPTEAEWEYACRAGSSSRYSFGNEEDQLGQYAWYSYNSNSEPHTVGLKKPNAFGLFDLHGNVWEWCADRYDKNYYRQSPRNNPQGPSPGTERVLRGGSWFNSGLICRSTARYFSSPDVRGYDYGFRVVVSARTQ